MYAWNLKNVKTVYKNSVNTLILKSLPKSCNFSIFLERWNSNFPDQNKALQIVTIAGKETEKNKFSCAATFDN